jgi:hypothetical protein
MVTIKEFAETNAGKKCSFIHYDFLSRPGVFTGTIVGYFENNHSLWVLISPDVLNIGELRSKTIGDNGFHWRESCIYYLLADMDKITLLPPKDETKPKWPNICHCGQPCQIIFQFIECSSIKCKNYKKQYA